MRFLVDIENLDEVDDLIGIQREIEREEIWGFFNNKSRPYSYVGDDYTLKFWDTHMRDYVYEKSGNIANLDNKTYFKDIENDLVYMCWDFEKHVIENCDLLRGDVDRWKLFFFGNRDYLGDLVMYTSNFWVKFAKWHVVCSKNPFLFES